MFAEANAACEAIWAENVKRMDEQFKGATGAELDIIMEVGRKVASLRQEPSGTPS